MIIGNVFYAERKNFMQYTMSKYYKQTPLIVFEIIRKYPYGKN